MKRKFEVTITKTDKYNVIIDEDKLPKNLIKDFEKNMHKLKGDKIKELAKFVGFSSMDNCDEFHEGIGYIRHDGYDYGRETINGIEIETEFTDSYETDITEIK